MRSFAALHCSKVECLEIVADGSSAAFDAVVDEQRSSNASRRPIRPPLHHLCALLLQLGCESPPNNLVDGSYELGHQRPTVFHNLKLLSRKVTCAFGTL